MTTEKKIALVVRGGWEGHQPVEATELFVPYLEATASTVRSRTRPPSTPTPPSWPPSTSSCSADDGHHRAGGARRPERRGRRRHGHGRLARRHRRLLPRLLRLPAAHRRPVRLPPGQGPGERHGAPADNYVPYTVTMLPGGRDHPITAGHRGLRPGHRAVLGAADDYIDVLATTTQKVRAWDPWHRAVTSPAIWTRQWGGADLRRDPGHSLDVLENDNVRTIIERGMLWASRDEHRRRRLRGHLSRQYLDTLAPLAGARPRRGGRPGPRPGAGESADASPAPRR